MKKEELLKIVKEFAKSPVKFLKERKELKDPKQVGILALGVSGVYTVCVLLVKMFKSIFVKECSFMNMDCKTIVSFEGLTNIHYFDVIFKTFLGTLVVFAIIALVYFIIALMMKKEADYINVLGLVVASLTSTLVVLAVIVPILGAVYFPLGYIATIMSVLYSFGLLILSLNENIKFKEKEQVLYYHVISLTTLATILYYVMNYVVKSALSFL